MANTKIQIKRSSITATPAGSSLSAAEPAYSYSSNTLFLGGSDGVGVLPIGGKFYVDQQSIIFAVSNAAFNAANSGSAGSNAYIQSVGTAGNNYTNSVGTAGNNYTNSVGTAGNNYASILAANNALAGNNYTNSVGLAGNNYTNSVGLAGNNYTNAVGAAGNNYTNAVGAASNNYSNATFVRLTAPSQTITGDLALTGNLIFLGNATSIVSNNLIVGDSLIYLAANNYSGTDILDIGFVANYANGTGANVHTGLLRDATTKQYYLFQGLDIELQSNNTSFVAGANGAVNAILNADIIANQLTLGGINVQPWITSAFTVANSSNGWANTVGVAGNNYTNSVGLAGNNYTNSVGTAGNNYASILVANVALAINANAAASYTAINSYATVMDTAGNNYASVLVANTAASINANAIASYAAINSYSQTVGTAGNNYSSILVANTAAAINSYAAFIGSSANSYAGAMANASNLTIRSVIYGGTGNTTFTTNGILFGNGTGPIQVTGAGTDGQVLQSDQGVPKFAMLDGGTF